MLSLVKGAAWIQKCPIKLFFCAGESQTYSYFANIDLSSTGTLQGTVLSPFLLTHHTSLFSYSSQSFHLQDFSDSSAFVGQEAAYRSVVDSFVE